MATPINTNFPSGSRTRSPDGIVYQLSLRNGQKYWVVQPAATSRGTKNIIPWDKTTTFPPTTISANQVNSSEKIGKGNGSILRYPYEALTDDTDYLQIDIRIYNSASAVSATVSGSGLASGRNQNNSSRRGNDPFNPNVKNITTKNLSTSPLITQEKKNNKVSIGTILLPMPSNIQSSNSVDFSNSNLDGLTADVYGQIEEFSKNLPVQKPNDFLTTLTTEAGRRASNLITNNGQIFGQLLTQQFYTQAANIPLGGSLTRDAIFARSKGEILNQNVELLFNGAKIRSFKFSFKLTPRNNNEAKQIKLIINAFKRHMVPKLTGQSSSSSVNNLFLKSPSIFELTYKSGNIKNPFLNSFKQCFLTDMSVNYTGEGTYAVYNDNDSTPVSMVLDLTFKELEPIYNQDYATANY